MIDIMVYFAIFSTTNDKSHKMKMSLEYPLELWTFWISEDPPWWVKIHKFVSTYIYVYRAGLKHLQSQIDTVKTAVLEKTTGQI